MADSTKNVAYEITADSSGFAKGMQDAAAAASTAKEQIEGNFKKVGEAFTSVTKQLAVLAGLVAGGAFFKEAIGATSAMTGETVKLAKTLGLTGEQANTLRTALGDIGADSDTYTTAFTKFAQQLRKNEDGIQDMGIKTRDANGNLRDSNTLFMEALQVVGRYKPGLDQTTAAMVLFGKSIDEVRTLQKYNNQVSEEAAAKNRELGLVVTQENVEASKKYKLAMNDVGDVLMAVKKSIGDALMPVFTRLGEWFAEIGPSVVSVFREAITALGVALSAIVGICKVVADAIRALVDPIFTLGRAIQNLIHGDMSGATREMQSLGSSWAQAFSDAGEKIKKDASNTWSDIQKTWNPSKAEIKLPKGGDDRMGDFKKGGGTSEKEKSRQPLWAAELEEQKLAYQEMKNAEGSFQQFSKESEIAFWRDKLALTTEGTKENVQVRRALAALQLEVGKEAFATELSRLKSEEAEYKNNLQAKLEILDREAALVAERYGRESKEYQDVQRQIVEAKRQAVEQIKQIDMIRADASRQAALAEVSAAELSSQLELELGNITKQQELAQQQAFETTRYQIAQEALMQRLSLAEKDPDRNPVELQRIHAELEALEQQHALRQRELLNQQVIESTAASRKITDSVLGDMEKSLSKMMQGQMKFRDFMRSIWTSITAAVSDALAKMLVDFIRNSTAMAAIKKALAAFNIGTSAAEAGAGAAASAAEIPIVGWIIAAGAAAAAFSMASSYGQNMPAFSAAGGFDIPGSVNPIIQAHEREMVLPAHIADPLRDSLANGGIGGGAPAQIQIHAMDAQSFKSWLGGSAGDVLAKHLAGRKRDFAS